MRHVDQKEDVDEEGKGVKPRKILSGLLCSQVYCILNEYRNYQATRTGSETSKEFGSDKESAGGRGLDDRMRHTLHYMRGKLVSNVNSNTNRLVSANAEIE
jgi:hypothetical protein